MTQRAVGIDYGGDTVRLVEGRSRKGAFEIHQAAAVPTGKLAEALETMGLRGLPVAVGITGRDMILRTTQVPPVPMWQLRELLSYEVADISEQSGDELCADFAMLGGAAAFTDEEMVLLALVRSSLVEERTDELVAAKAKVIGFTPNAVALHNAVVATDGGEGTVMAVSLRGRHADIALIHDGELLFARNLSGGGDVFTEAIAEAFGVDEGKAEQAKLKLGVFARPGEKLAGQQEKVARSLDGALRQLVGMLQSTVALCRNQLQAPNLEVDRVLLCGAGASVPRLDEALTRALGLPVAWFDPTEGYVVGDAPVLDERGGDFAVAAGLAMMATLDGAYRLAIVSEAARKARHFKQHTLWLVLAGVLVVAHLAAYGWWTHADAALRGEDAARLQREAQSREREVQTYSTAVERAQEASAKLSAVEQVTAPGSGLLLVLDLLDAYLPEELWVTQVSTTRSVVPDFDWGGTPRPHVWVRGAGKELDRNLSGALVELTERLRAQPGVADVVMRYEDDRGRFGFELRVDTSVRPHEADDDASAADDGAG
ncbi:MAG: pilus assembly protein PilM [Planctomycetes bacterium]|nr:pilus assembly protein PilM [Planctomycetota bacterium]